MIEKALFAAGCFWGVELSFQSLKGVITTTVGYAGGNDNSPDYAKVATGETGHAEAIEIIFDPGVITFEEFAKHFFGIHNPALFFATFGKRSQYRSAIFYYNDEQKEISENLVEILRQKGFGVRTEIIPVTFFYMAEEKHQNYYNKKGLFETSKRYKKKF